jgi:hypothetical protein
VLGTLFYKGIRFERREIGPITRKFFIFFFLPIFYLALFNSVTNKDIPRLKKYWRGICPRPPTPKLNLWEDVPVPVCTIYREELSDNYAKGYDMVTAIPK